jgi:hypothetical protein
MRIFDACQESGRGLISLAANPLTPQPSSAAPMPAGDAETALGRCPPASVAFASSFRYRPMRRHVDVFVGSGRQQWKSVRPRLSERSKSHRSTSRCRYQLRPKSRLRSRCRRRPGAWLERGPYRADHGVAALACPASRGRAPARVVHVASRELACSNSVRGAVLRTRPGGACSGPRMRHLRSEDAGARRRPPEALYRGSSALRTAVRGAAPAAKRMSHRSRPRFALGPRRSPRERVPRTVRIPVRAVPDRRQRRPRSRASAPVCSRRLAELLAHAEHSFRLTRDLRLG